jgi:hypothetical protein
MSTAVGRPCRDAPLERRIHRYPRSTIGYIVGRGGRIGRARRRGEALLTPEELNGRLRAHGAHGLAGCLRNGLSEQENRDLIAALDARHAVELVLRGLQAGRRDGAGTD